MRSSLARTSSSTSDVRSARTKFMSYTGRSDGERMATPSSKRTTCSAEASSIARRNARIRATSDIAELDDVAAEEQRDGPVGHDAELPREERELVQVIGARDEPAEE